MFGIRCLLIIFSIVLLLQHSVCKDMAVYQASGIQLVDLIRGYTPKEGLMLTKVKGDRTALPDGIYFEPEDEALNDPNGSKFLHLNGFKKKSAGNTDLTAIEN